MTHQNALGFNDASSQLARPPELRTQALPQAPLPSKALPIAAARARSATLDPAASPPLPRPTARPPAEEKPSGISRGLQILGKIGTVLSATGAGLQGDTDFINRLNKAKSDQEAFALRKATLQFDMFAQAAKIAETIPADQQEAAFAQLNEAAQPIFPAFDAAIFAKSTESIDIDTSLFDQFTKEGKAQIMQLAEQIGGDISDVFEHPVFKFIQDGEEQRHASNATLKLDTGRDILTERGFDLNELSGLTWGEYKAGQHLLPEEFRLLPGEIAAIESIGPDNFGFAETASDIEEVAAAKARGATSVDGAAKATSRKNFRAARGDVTLPDGTVIKSGQDISLRPNDPDIQDLLNSGDLVQVSTSGRVGDTSSALTTAATTNIQKSLVQTEAIDSALDTALSVVEADIARGKEGVSSFGIGGAAAGSGLAGTASQIPIISEALGSVTGLTPDEIQRIQNDRSEVGTATRMALRFIANGIQADRFTNADADDARQILGTLQLRRTNKAVRQDLLNLKREISKLSQLGADILERGVQAVEPTPEGGSDFESMSPDRLLAVSDEEFDRMTPEQQEEFLRALSTLAE